MNCIGICGVSKYITIKHKGVNVNFQQLLLLKSSISTRDTEVNDMKMKLNYRIHGHLIPYHWIRKPAIVMCLVLLKLLA